MGTEMMKLFARLSNLPEFRDAVFCVGQRRILEDGVITFSLLIGFRQEEDDLLAREVVLLEAGFRAVKVFNRIALFEATFEWLDHDCVDLPILITANAIRDLGMLDANVCNDGDRFVVVSEIAERRPLWVVL